MEFEDEFDNEPEPTYCLGFYAHCGMSTMLEDEVSMQEARDRAAKILRRRRNTGHYIDVLDKGRRWEACEPEDCALVPDTAGILSIQQSVTRHFRYSR